MSIEILLFNGSKSELEEATGKQYEYLLEGGFPVRFETTDYYYGEYRDEYTPSLRQHPLWNLIREYHADAVVHVTITSNQGKHGGHYVIWTGQPVREKR